MSEQEKARAERFVEKFKQMPDAGKIYVCAYGDGMMAAIEMLKNEKHAAS